MSESIKFRIKSETGRCVAYICFWGMAFFAKTMTNLFVNEKLLAGADPSVPDEQKGCGPFNRGPDSEFGLDYGEGFDYETQSHLVELFGYGNICTAWDYSPSREYTAMVFPAFEYTLVIYLVLDYFNTVLAYKRGEVPDWFFLFSRCCSLLCIPLCIMFRMIFVYIAYENVSMHTFGFLCLQFGLVLVAIQNTWFVVITKQTFPTCGLDNPATVALIGNIYLILNLAISSIKIVGTMYIVATGTGPAFYKIPTSIKGMVLGQVIDVIWMIFNAVLPFVIAVVRAKNEDPMEFEISLPKVGTAGEQTPLTSAPTGATYA